MSGYVGCLQHANLFWNCGVSVCGPGTTAEERCSLKARFGSEEDVKEKSYRILLLQKTRGALGSWRKVLTDTHAEMCRLIKCTRKEVNPFNC